LKPQLPDIAANLLIHTDRRTYSIELISLTTEEYMPFVGFLYPEQPQQTSIADSESWENLLKQYQLANDAQSRENEKKARNNARLADPATIYTGYTVKVTKGKNIAWKPKDVYDANGKTYIVMPDKMQITESPVFFIKQNGREKLTNYRVEGNIYIVDRIFDIGILTIGKDRVAIYRKTPVGVPEKEVIPAIANDTPQPTEERNTAGLSIKIGSGGVDIVTDFEEEIHLAPALEEVKEGAKETSSDTSPQTPPVEATAPVKESVSADVQKRKDSLRKKDDQENTEPAKDDWQTRWEMLIEKYDLSDTNESGKGQKDKE
jgi:type IV secretory pathway VirB9-like protein